MGALDDKLDFFGSDLGKSLSVTLGAVSAVSIQLAPRRYLIQFIDTGVNRVWARMGAFSATAPPVAAASSPSTPFAGATPTLVASFEVNVRKGFNDQIAAIMQAGTGKMIITPRSRVTTLQQ